MFNLNTILIILIIITILKIISNYNIDNINSESFAPISSDDLDDNAPVDSEYYLTTPSVGWLSRCGLLPFWNSTRDTKNMSYDIRGDIQPFTHPVCPWLNPSVTDRPFGYTELF
jgi:hypothetical protein